MALVPLAVFARHADAPGGFAVVFKVFEREAAGLQHTLCHELVLLPEVPQVQHGTAVEVRRAPPECRGPAFMEAAALLTFLRVLLRLELAAATVTAGTGCNPPVLLQRCCKVLHSLRERQFLVAEGERAIEDFRHDLVHRQPNEDLGAERAAGVNRMVLGQDHATTIPSDKEALIEAIDRSTGRFVCQHQGAAELELRVGKTRDMALKCNVPQVGQPPQLHFAPCVPEVSVVIPIVRLRLDLDDFNRRARLAQDVDPHKQPIGLECRLEDRDVVTLQQQAGVVELLCSVAVVDEDTPGEHGTCERAHLVTTLGQSREKAVISGTVDVRRLARIEELGRTLECKLEQALGEMTGVHGVWRIP